MTSKFMAIDRLERVSSTGLAKEYDRKIVLESNTI